MEFDAKLMEFSQKNLKQEQARTIENYKRLNKIAPKGQILFTGSSLMEQFPVVEMSISHGLGKAVFNRGVGGFTTFDFIDNIDTMLLDLEPSVVFINIGTNDLRLYQDGSTWQETLYKNYDYILGKCKETLPGTKVFVMAYYPMDEENEEGKMFAKMFGAVRTNATLAQANAMAKSLADKYAYNYIDVNDGLTDEKGNLKVEFCKDSIHMYADGYEVVYKNLEKYLKEL